MTCTTNAPRSAAAILDDILATEEDIRSASDAEAARRLRNILRELVWQQTLAIDAEERARIEDAYPVEVC